MVLFQFPKELFNSTAAGDLIFFSRQANSNVAAAGTDFEAAVCACVGGNVFHVAIGTGVDENFKLIQATTKQGVIEESLDECLSREFEGCDAGLLLTFAKVAVEGIAKEKVIEFARSKIGTAYNDIFSETCKNSGGKEAYYCCQLVRKAYTAACGNEIFPTQPLSFHSSDGQIIPYWIDYFAERNLPVPTEGIGSHPSKLFASDVVIKLCSMLVLSDGSCTTVTIA